MRRLPHRGWPLARQARAGARRRLRCATAVSADPTPPPPPPPTPPPSASRAAAPSAGACGILAARCGASSVQLTDLAPLLPLLRRNAAANGVADCCSAVELEWGCPLPPFLLEPSSLDIILGADITAFVQSLPQLTTTLRQLS